MIDRPMKPRWFRILLALAERPLHGYGIQRAVLEQTDEQMRLWPAMLYRSLARLEAEGLLVKVEAPGRDLTGAHGPVARGRGPSGPGL